MVDQQYFIKKQHIMDKTRGPTLIACPICGVAMLRPIVHGEWHLELELRFNEDN